MSTMRGTTNQSSQIRIIIPVIVQEEKSAGISPSGPGLSGPVGATTCDCLGRWALGRIECFVLVSGILLCKWRQKMVGWTKLPTGVSQKKMRIKSPKERRFPLFEVVFILVGN